MFLLVALDLFNVAAQVFGDGGVLLLYTGQRIFHVSVKPMNLTRTGQLVLTLAHCLIQLSPRRSEKDSECVKEY